jgi:hypothetical protein
MSEIYVAIERSDGTVAHMAFQTECRAPSKPQGQWMPAANGVWTILPTDFNIAFEVARTARTWEAEGVSVVSWKRLTLAEHEQFNEYRHHRDALELVGGKVQHNMPKARELHKHLLRHQRAEKLLVLDGVYNGAVAQKNNAKADAVEAKRQELRDLTSDPRIDAATTVAELVQVGFTEDGETALEDVRSFVRSL